MGVEHLIREVNSPLLSWRDRTASYPLGLMIQEGVAVVLGLEKRLWWVLIHNVSIMRFLCQSAAHRKLIQCIKF